MILPQTIEELLALEKKIESEFLEAILERLARGGQSASVSILLHWNAERKGNNHDYSSPS